jgi:hypothetical protein
VASKRSSESVSPSRCPLPQERHVSPLDEELDDDKMDVDEEWESSFYSSLSSDQGVESDEMDVDDVPWSEDVEMIDMTTEGGNWQPARDDGCNGFWSQWYGHLFYVAQLEL